MDFGFTQDQETLRASVREVLAERSNSAVLRAVLDSDDGTDAALWRTVGELGWTGVAIDEAHAGLGMGLLELAIISEEMGRAAAPVPFFSTVAFAAQVVEQVDATPARDAFLAAVAAGEKRATVVLGADGTLPSAAAVTLAATESGDGFSFAGETLLAPDAHVADELVVPARLDGGVALFVVPAAAAKVETQKSLDGGRRLARVALDGVVVGSDALLARDAGTALERGIDRAAVLLAAEAVGVAQEVLDRTVAYAKERTQFDRPIGSFQAISHRCADMMLVTETARSHTYYAAWALEEGSPDARVAAAAAKASAADAARIVAGGGIQAHGGIGFTWEHDLHLFYRRAKFCELFLGDAGLWRERIAASLAS